MGILILSMLAGAGAAAVALMAGHSFLIALLAYSGCGTFCAVILTFALPAAQRHLPPDSTPAKDRPTEADTAIGSAPKPKPSRAKSV